MKCSRTLVTGALAFGVLLGSVTPVLADVTEGIKGGLQTAAQGSYVSGTDVKVRSLQEIIGSLISAVIGIFGALLLLYLIYGGFLWMTAGGDEAKVKKARDLIKNAVIGIVIVASAYAIANYVLGILSTAITGATPNP